MDIDQIATQFVQSYYSTFDNDRSQLAALYTQESVLSFEGTKFQGPQAISGKLTSLPFQKVQHAVTTVDALLHPTGLLLVHVVGQLKIIIFVRNCPKPVTYTDDDPVHGFSQSFVLQQIGDSLFVSQDVFRLALHNLG